MRFVTKLMKMNLEAKAVVVQREQLKLTGRSGNLDGEMYIRPTELVDIIRLGLNPSVISFLVFFPYYLLIDYLRENDGDHRHLIFAIGRVAALLLVAVLLVASFPHFARYPLQAALLLATFAGLFLAAYVGGRVSTVFYAFVILAVVSYYLVFQYLGLAEDLYPVLSLPVLVVLDVAAKQLGRSRYREVSQPLYNAAYLTTLFFAGYVAWNAVTYLTRLPWMAALSLFAFSALYWGRYIQTRRVRHQYMGLLFLIAGYLFYLVSLVPTQTAYYGVWLGALGIVLAAVGVLHRRASDLAHVGPMWVTAMVLPLAGLAFGLDEPTALLLCLTTLSVSSYLVSRTAAASNPDRYSGEWWFATVPFGIANLAAVAIAFGLFEFRPALGAVVSSLALAVLYHQIARDRGPAIIQSRNVYLHISTFFVTMFSLLVLTTLNPFGYMQLNTPLLLLPSLGVVGYAYLREGRGHLREATSLYEGSYFLMAAALALPVLTGGHSASFSSLVGVGFLVLYFGFMSLSRNEGLLYAPLIIAAYLLYNALSAVQADSLVLCVVYGAIGLALMLAALKVRQNGRPLARMLYFGWFLFSGLSVLGAARELPLVIYALTFWSVGYVVAARFVTAAENAPSFFRSPIRGLRNWTELVGSLAGVAALALVAYHQSMTVAVVVTGSLAVAYIAAFLLTRVHVYLYPASLLLSTAYLLSLKAIASYDDGLFFMLPLLLALGVLGHYLWRKELRRLTLPLTLAAHVIALAAIGLVVYYQDLVTMPALVVTGLLLYVAMDGVLIYLERERWYLLPALIFLSLALYFVTAVPGGQSLDVRLAELAPVAVLFAGLPVLARGRMRAEVSHPVLAAAVLVALGVGAASFQASGAVGAQLAVTVSAIAFAVVYLVLARPELIYLIVLALGMLAYQFLLASVDYFSRGLVEMFAIGLVLCSIIFIVPPALRAIGFTRPLSKLVLEYKGWAFVLSLPLFFAAPMALGQFTLTATSNPTFCSSCHSMKSFYETWRTSAHVQKANPPVGCDTCHYPPGGPDVVLTGRFTGLLMTLDELGGFQPSKFHARVTDASCLQCHNKESLDKWITFKGIRFNHRAMITQRVRGIELNCTTCHARTTDYTGQHFEVSPTVCYYCHLVGRATQQGTAVGTCYTCHDSSIQTKVAAGYVTVGGMAGSRVEESRCLSCHAKGEKIDDVNLMHEAHVNRVKVFGGRKAECFECHGEIKHGNFGTKNP